MLINAADPDEVEKFCADGGAVGVSLPLAMAGVIRLLRAEIAELRSVGPVAAAVESFRERALAAVDKEIEDESGQYDVLSSGVTERALRNARTAIHVLPVVGA